MTRGIGSRKSSNAERNRRNARRSTGPRTPAGKAISRRNSLRHGLCANPAAGVVEDGGQFELLYAELTQAIPPRNILEEQLVHQIAVSLWRRQRATRIDAAISGIAVEAVQPWREEVQGWIERINGAWQVECIRERDPVSLKRRIEAGKLQPGEIWLRHVRPYLCTLDVIRDQIMRSGSGITAMMTMLVALAGKLDQVPGSFRAQDTEQLAWLLGESADRLPYDEDDVTYTDQQQWKGETDRLIGEARRRKPGKPMPKALDLLIRQRLDTLRQQREVCEDPYTTEQWQRKRIAALLPDAPTLDRLIRYETHAERSLLRALETLAKLRGAMVETVAAIMTRPEGGPAALTVHGRQECWSPNGSGFAKRTQPESVRSDPPGDTADA